MDHDTREISLLPPSFLLNPGYGGLGADMRSFATLPHRTFLTSASPSLGPAHTQAPLTLSVSLTTSLPVSRPWIKARAATRAWVIWDRGKRVRETIGSVMVQSRPEPRGYKQWELGLWRSGRAVRGVSGGSGKQAQETQRYDSLEGMIV